MTEQVSVRRSNTLSREGIGGTGSIQPATPKNLVKSSYFVRKFKTKSELVKDRRFFKLEEDSYFKHMLSDPVEWISLGSSWYQITHANSGKCTPCGLHTVLECNHAICAILYEPQSINCNNACVTGINSSSIEYDLHVSIKCLPSSNVGCGIVFGFKNISNYCVLVCDIENKQWELGIVKDDTYLIVKESVDNSMKENIFQNVFIQIRNDTISVDVNDRIVFTSTRMHGSNTSLTEVVFLNGLVGIILHVSYLVT